LVKCEQKREAAKSLQHALVYVGAVHICGAKALQIVGEHKDMSKKRKDINSIEANV
jgi:hypothetical protein